MSGSNDDCSVRLNISIHKTKHPKAFEAIRYYKEKKEVLSGKYNQGLVKQYEEDRKGEKLETFMEQQQEKDEMNAKLDEQLAIVEKHPPIVLRTEFTHEQRMKELHKTVLYAYYLFESLEIKDYTKDEWDRIKMVKASTEKLLCSNSNRMNNSMITAVIGFQTGINEIEQEKNMSYDEAHEKIHKVRAGQTYDPMEYYHLSSHSCFSCGIEYSRLQREQYYAQEKGRQEPLQKEAHRY